MTYRWKPSKTVKREFAQKMQNYKLLKLLNSEVRQTKKVKAVKAPSTFDILEDASWQYDTEDEILGYAEVDDELPF